MDEALAGVILCVFLVFFIFIVEFWNWSQVAYLSYVMIIEGKIQIVIGIGIDAYWMFIYNCVLLIMLFWVWIVLPGYYVFVSF
jgi:hypothetical protein